MGRPTRVRAKSALSDRYELSDGTDTLTTVNIGWMREAGEFRLDGETYTVGRRGLTSGLFYVEQDGEVLATADKPSALSSRFRVRHGSKSYELSRSSMLGRAFELKRGGDRVGSVTPTSALKRSARISLPGELSVPVQVFITWLVLVMWKRMEPGGE